MTHRDPPTTESAQPTFDGGQADHERGEAQHRLQLRTLRQRIDDPPDDQRPEDRGERGQTDDDDPEGDPDLVLSEVVKESGSRGGH